MVDIDTIVQILAPAVSELGLELYDVDLTGTGRARVLRVMVDREGGVDLDAIAAATAGGLAAARRAAARRGDRRAVRARGEQPGPRAPAPHARRTSPGRVGETISVKVRPATTTAPGACAASSPPPTTPASSSLLDDGTHRAHRVRRRHAGAHGLRVGDPSRSAATSKDAPSPRSPARESHLPREPVRR